MHLNELLDVSLPTSFTDLIPNTKTYPPLQMRKKDTNYPSEPMGVGLYTFTIKQFS